MDLIQYILAGFGVGIAVGMTGVGGGSLMTPLLIIGFGIPIATAVGVDLLYATGTKSFGSALYGRRRSVDWRTVGLMALGSLPAAVATIIWLNVIGIKPWVEHLMSITLCAAIFATAILSFYRARLVGSRSVGAESVLTPPIEGNARAVVTVIGGVVLGVMVTLSSVGAGVLGTTMLLLLYPQFSMFRIVGTDIAHAVPLTLVAGIGHLSLGNTNLFIVGALLLGSLPGIWVGTQLAYRVPDRWLRALVSIILLVAGSSMLWHTLKAYGLFA